MILQRSTPALYAILLALGLLFTFFCYRLALNGPVWEPELRATNMLFGLRGPREVRNDIMIVAVNNQERKMLDADGDPNRRQLAQLIRKARAGGAKAIVLDVHLPERTSRAVDRDLWLAIANAGNVFLPAAYNAQRGNVLSQADIRNLRFLEESIMTNEIAAWGTPPPEYTFWKFVLPVSDFTQSAAGRAGGVGVAPLETDPDGVLRRIRMAYQTDIRYPDGSRPSRLINQGNVTNVAVPSIVIPVTNHVVNVNKTRVKVEYGKTIDYLGDLDPPISIPVDKQGRMLINYVGPVGTFPYVNAADVLDGEVKQSEFENKIVFIGLTEGEKADFRPTPYDAAAPRVDITANAVATVLDREFVPQSREGAWIPLGFLALFLALTLPFFSMAGATLWALISLIGYVGIAWLSLNSGWGLLPLLPAILLILLMWLTSMILRPVLIPQRVAYA